MEAIGLNPIRLDRIGLDPIRVNAIKLGAPGAASGSARPYIDPEVLASLVAVCICDGKSNNDPDRAVIKNLVDPDNPFVISNAAYKLNSGYGKYEEDFTTWRISKSGIVSTINVNSIHITRIKEPLPDSLAFFENGTTTNRKFNIKLKISGLTSDMKCTLNNQGSIIKELANGVNEISADLVTGWYGFMIIKLDGSIIGDCDITITQIPSHQGAFVTDGKDDLITSTKTVKEMLGGSNEVTVVSMMANLDSSQIMCNSNFSNTNGYNVRNTLEPNGVISMLGYTDKNGTTNNLNLIMGDKNSIKLVDKVNFNSDYVFHPSSYNAYSFKTAWYWTIIANKVLTTDQINQVISYFNLDKHVKPDVYYDVKKQGLSNDTPEADWYLKDFSGNGHDMTLYNFAKKLDSGIGKYKVDFNTWIPQSYVADSTYTSNKLHVTNIKGGNAILYTKKGANAMKVKITGIQSFNLVYRYIAENDVWEALEVDRDGIYELPASTTTTKTYYTGFTVPYYTGDCDITIEQIPDYEGALVSDGIDDYGKVENLPIYKDYTVVADREIVDGLIDNADGGVATRSYNYAKGAFGFDWKNQAFSFGGNTDRIIDVQRFISYQSKYVNNGIQLITGNVVDNNPLYMARLGEENRYSKLALWSFLLFPYSLSEFLLERQLKKYKLGTLYPDMVEFRPIIKNNNQYRRIDFYTQSWDKKIYPGDYVPINSILRANIYLNNELNELQSFRINGVNVTFVKSSVDKTAYNIGNIPIAKSPQKIDITIDEYIRFEDIIQPYPAIVNLSQDGKSITWGDKLKVGSEVTFVNHTNLLPDLYTVSGGVQYNGTSISWNTSIRVEKSMVFVNPHSYKKANEPNCILAPQTLRIPNSSYKILGYIPDLTGKGNHGRLNNFAYTEESGANEDGSIRFDGTDDHITISTLAHGGKCMLMKVNWNKDALMLYDQRRDNNPNSFAIYIPNFNNEDSIAYSSRNDGKTYIDGVLNTSVKGSQLKDVTHNITITNSNSNNDNTVSPAIGSNAKYNAFYAQMVLYEFMLLPDVPDEEEIKELNEVMGIENNIEVS